MLVLLVMHKALTTPLTPAALRFFIYAGYEFCLFNRIYNGDNVSAAVLTPLKEPPHLKRLQNCESVFRTCEEPLEMINDKSGPPILMELDFDCLGAFVDFLLKNKSPMKLV